MKWSLSCIHYSLAFILLIILYCCCFYLNYYSSYVLSCFTEIDLLIVCIVIIILGWFHWMFNWQFFLIFWLFSFEISKRVCFWLFKRNNPLFLRKVPYVFPVHCLIFNFYFLSSFELLQLVCFGWFTSIDFYLLYQMIMMFINVIYGFITLYCIYCFFPHLNYWSW